MIKASAFIPMITLAACSVLPTSGSGTFGINGKKVTLTREGCVINAEYENTSSLRQGPRIKIIGIDSNGTTIETLMLTFRQVSSGERTTSTTAFSEGHGIGCSEINGIKVE
jgi:hypothetical protein